MLEQARVICVDADHVTVALFIGEVPQDPSLGCKAPPQLRYNYIYTVRKWLQLQHQITKKAAEHWSKRVFTLHPSWQSHRAGRLTPDTLYRRLLCS